jgi:tRNA-splicing ligase RtcB (3'-phosphate/5'-hydroxy nucleic acid ligase)
MEYTIREGSVDAKVFLDKFMIDKGTMRQIREMIYHPAIQHARVMPDCHRGTGCCVGFTSHLGEKIVPNFVGGDIGCGILTYPMGNILESISVKKLEEIIKTTIPMGATDDCVHKGPVFDLKDLGEVYNSAWEEAIMFAKTYEKKFKTNIKEYIPKYSLDWLKEKCKQIDIDFTYVLSSLGTLGGGNHYVEVNQDKNKNCYLTIHSGSRNFGSKICQHHQSKINETKFFNWDEYHEQMKKVRRNFKNPKQLKLHSDQIKDSLIENKHPDYLEKEEAYLYFFDMIFAQKYAQFNRHLMLKLVLGILDIKFDPEKLIESTHNYIDFTDMILRKGAISAHKDKKCIVSLNMRDGILICTGKGNEDWNYSSAHGSGRIFARHEVIHRTNMIEFKESMKDVYSTTVVPETLDESPMVYKDSEMIKKALGDTVDIVEQLKPVINVKGTK